MNTLVNELTIGYLLEEIQFNISKAGEKHVFLFKCYDGYNVSELFNTPLERETILNVQNKIDTLLPVVGVWQFALANNAFFVL